MEMDALWSKTCELLRGEIAPYSFDAFIGNNLTPIRITGDTLYLGISMEPMVVMIRSRYSAVIDRCLSEAAHVRMHAEIVTADDRKKLEQEGHVPAQENGDTIQLNPKYTFDTFIVGSNNRLAHAAALAVAEAPSEAYNPLFIYGGAGLGKTHLMHAIGHHVKLLYPEKRLLYITSEAFTNELIRAIQQKHSQEFRDRFRNVDILMVDDIQFIAGRDSTQEEFFHTFNDLHLAGKQIILTSDKPPQSIARLEERLASRFAWGMTADISRPDIETRLAILLDKAEQMQLTVPNDVLELIAQRVDSNIRELEGCLTSLKGYANLVGQPIDMKLCREALKNILERKTDKAITPEGIQKAVCEYFSVSQEDLISSSRKREIALPRQIAVYLTR